MTLALALAILAIAIPAIIGWFVLMRSFTKLYLARHEAKTAQHTAAEYAAMIVQAQRTPIQRRRRLRAIAGGKDQPQWRPETVQRTADCEIVTLGRDGPEAA